MISDLASGRLAALALAAGFSLRLTSAALAGQPTPAPIWPAMEPAEGVNQGAAQDTDAPADKAETADADVPDIMKDIDVSKLDWSQLSPDATAASNLKTRSAPQKADAGGLDWSSKDQANGASGVSVKQSVSPFWDARVGADMTVTREPATMSELLAEKSANGGSLPQSGGSAWAAVTAPGAGPVWDKTAVEARVNPDTDQSKLGTSISKQVPLNDQASLTLSNGYNMTQQGMVPVPGMVSRPERTYDTDQSARVELSDTGTSVTAGQTLSTSDDKWLRKVGAEQKLFGGVTVSGSIGETSQGTINKTISAGFKKSW
jgi:hypothetical protein